MPDPGTPRTKIVCTIGPASRAPEVLEAMVRAGMGVARLNLAHGDFEGHAETIARVRAASRTTGRRVAILADLPGPKLRIGTLADGSVELHPGAAFAIAVGDFAGDAKRVATSFADLPRVVEPGHAIFLNDGLIRLEVERVAGDEVQCRVVAGGCLLSNKGMNLPEVELGEAFTDRDRECLAFALGEGVDAVSQSFVQRARDVEAVREAIRAQAGGRPGGAPLVLAKIERAAALRDIDRIVAASDGIMVARGDLGVEIPIERIAVVQKDLIARANAAAKPVITATQMLLSMVSSRRPTRAEVTDVSNAILDGTDCIMLSEESAAGEHPVESVQMLSRIAAETEPRLVPRPVGLQTGLQNGGAEADDQALIAESVALIARRVPLRGILVPSRTGTTARRIAAYRLPLRITAVSPSEATCQALQLSYGIDPIHVPDPPPSWREFARRHFAGAGGNGRILMTEGTPAAGAREGGSNRLEILEL